MSDLAIATLVVALPSSAETRFSRSSVFFFCSSPSFPPFFYLSDISHMTYIPRLSLTIQSDEYSQLLNCRLPGDSQRRVASRSVSRYWVSPASCANTSCTRADIAIGPLHLAPKQRGADVVA